MTLHLVPCTVKSAIKWVAEHHRHLRRELAGARFGVALADGNGEWVGVAIVTSGPRVWESTGRCNIARVCTTGVKNGCSKLYGAICRAAQALGYSEAWTYTLPEEPGTSLRAAGFTDMGLTDGGEHSRASRPRRPAERPEPKRRWRRLLTQPPHAAPEDK